MGHVRIISIFVMSRSPAAAHVQEGVCLGPLVHRMGPGMRVAGLPGMSVRVNALQMLEGSLTGALVAEDGMAGSKAIDPERFCVRAVPKILHFIWLQSPLREPHAQHILGFADRNPAWQVWIWVDRPIKNTSRHILRNAAHRAAGGVIVRNLRRVAWRFRNWDIIREEQNAAAMSDYLRLEFLYLYGGVYLDCDSVALRGFDEYGLLFTWPFVVHTVGSVFRGTVYNDLCNCMLGAEPGSSFLSFALNVVRENCLRFGACGVLGAGSGALTAVFLRYSQPDIAMISQDYLLRLDGQVKGQSIMYQRFEASWVADRSVEPYH